MTASGERTVVRPPEAEIAAAFERFATLTGAIMEYAAFDVGNSTQKVVTLRLNDLRIVLVSLTDYKDEPSIRNALRGWLAAELPTDQSHEVLFTSTSPQNMASRVVVDRGVSLVPLHVGIARTLSLPTSWLRSQHELLQSTLASVTVNEQRRLADLYATEVSAEPVVAQHLLTALLLRWDRRPEPLIYFRAEAGKGKSTLLANAAVEQMERGDGPLPLFIPLRTLQRGRGVSWSELCGAVGILGDAVGNLAAGVRAGLVTLMLDGLDEVAGRYDQTIVRQVLDAIEPLTTSETSCVVVSGRTTEATLLDRSRTRLLGIELPSGSDPAFETYADMVTRDVTPRWPQLARRVPEPPIRIASLRDLPPTDNELATIVEWLKLVFDELGKERSLFFVQSLACLGRSLQLDGNQPLVIRQKGAGAKLAGVTLYDVSILASALACIREQDKIEDLAREFFVPARQIELLMLYSLVASAQTSAAGSLPTPNSSASKVFDLDTVNQNEEFTAVLRQMQKHAILFAASGEGIRAGDWRPQFLSDWVRCALLCRAWLRRRSLGTVSTPLVSELVGRAERARIAIRVPLPGIADP